MVAVTEGFGANKKRFDVSVKPLIRRWPKWTEMIERTLFFNYSNCSFIHFCSNGFEELTFDPTMAKPDLMLAFGAYFLISLTIEARPLPSWVEKGIITLSLKSNLDN